MSTYRWYVLARVVPLADGKIRPIPPGELYEFVSWHRSDDGMRAQRAKLDRKGRQAIHVFSSSRAQAVRDAIRCYDVRVYGYDVHGRVVKDG